ncbi:MAG TPA: bifunctional glutamine synthetase adenylyltransferase/deadenyltransferase, partial [Methylophilaceae bacterium]|nr:bifunctional glutamine synthetase adenylyltransferase/deadenyltransferase [Methylophilaceae bacterium]
MLTPAQILEENAPLTEDESRLRHAMRCSPFVQRLLHSDATLLPDLMQHLHAPWTGFNMHEALEAYEVNDDASLKKALRRLRSRVMLRVIVRDLCGLGDLQEVMHSMTALAETSVQFALQHLTAWQEAIYGSPIGESGAKQDFIVVGMGKLGGGELNVSSDVDLIFAYEEDGETNGAKVISNFDFFVRLAKKLIAAIDEITEDGFVFRVDMRLRPYGSDGPLASSFAML